MAITDPLVKDWINANMEWLHYVAPATGAIFVVALGRFLAAKAEREHKEVVDLASGDQQS